MGMTLYKDMDDEALVAAYWAVRGGAANAADIACHTSPRSNGNRVMARQTGRLLRDLDVIVAVARRRGLRLVGGAA